MDKQNYSINEAEKQVLKENCAKIKRRICQKMAGIFQRKRVLKDVTVLLHAIFRRITDGMSYQRLADYMGVKYGVYMTDTAWKKQLNKAAPLVLQAVFELLHEQNPEAPEQELFGHHACAIDATDLPMEGKNTAAARVHTVYDFSGKNLWATVTDEHVGESVKQNTIKEGYLYLADRAYGRTPQMEYMFAQKADFLFRIAPKQVNVYKDADCKEKIDFVSLLTDRTEDLSLNCFIKGQSAVRAIRVCASPLPRDKAETAVKRVKKKSVKKQNRIQPETVLFAQWLVVATSLPDTVSARDILSAYRKRWQIELHFKRAKSLLKFHKLRRFAGTNHLALVSLWLAVTVWVSLVYSSLPSAFSSSLSQFNAFSLIAFAIA